VQGGLSVARSSHRTIASSLADNQHLFTHRSLVVVANLPLVLSHPSAVLVALLAPHQPWVISDRSALLSDNSTGFLTFRNGDQIISVRRSFAGLDLVTWTTRSSGQRHTGGASQ